MNFPPPLRTSYPFPPYLRPYTTIAASGGTFLYRAAYAPMIPRTASATSMPTTINIVSSPAIVSPHLHLLDDEGVSLDALDLHTLPGLQTLFGDRGDEGPTRRVRDDENLAPQPRANRDHDFPRRPDEVLEPVLARRLALHEHLDHHEVDHRRDDRGETRRKERDADRRERLRDLQRRPERAEERPEHEEDGEAQRGDSRPRELAGVRCDIVADASRIDAPASEVQAVADVEVDVEYAPKAPEQPHRDEEDRENHGDRQVHEHGVNHGLTSPA